VLISIGNQHFVENNLIVEILKPEGARAMRLRRKAAGNRMLINATEGKTIRSMIRLNSGHVVLSAVAPSTLESRRTKNAEPSLAGRRLAAHRVLKPDIQHSKQHDPVERRKEPDRRRFLYTAYIPERRSGVERRRVHHDNRRLD
jgi:regulator of extracellular matrix RemA (YlzA/DUF370 family)